MAPTADDKYLWVASSNNHRVMRIKDPLINPRVDVVIGQKGIAYPGETYCNRDPNGEPNPNAPLNYLCLPGSIGLDGANNLYVSDSAIEFHGNRRLLRYDAGLFTPGGNGVLYDVSASKSFVNIATWEPAFDRQQRLFIGYNSKNGAAENPYPAQDDTNYPLYRGRFFGVYSHPLLPSTTTVPELLLSDLHSMPMGATFDDKDNLYVRDLDRGRVLIYKQPAYGQPVTWAEMYNADATGNRPFNSIVKNGGVDLAWDSSGVSTLAIQSGNGYAQTTVDALNQWRMFGLAHNNSTHSYTDIDFAMFLKADNKISIYELGQWKADLAISFGVGDILRVSVENGYVKYYKNGQVIYSSGGTPYYPLWFDTSLASIGGRIGNAYLGGDDLGAVTWDPLSAQNVEIRGNSLRKTGGVDLAWDASAASVRKLWSGNGYAQVTIDDPTTWRMFGLTSSNTSHSYTDIDFCVFIKDDGYITVYQRGSFVADLPVHVEKGDIVKLAIKSGTVKLYRNHELICPSPNCQFTLPITYPLMVDDSIASLTGLTYNPEWGGRIYNVFLNGDYVH
jgi:hypothetical protein